MFSSDIRKLQRMSCVCNIMFELSELCIINTTILKGEVIMKLIKYLLIIVVLTSCTSNNDVTENNKQLTEIDALNGLVLENEKQIVLLKDEIITLTEENKTSMEINQKHINEQDSTISSLEYEIDKLNLDLEVSNNELDDINSRYYYFMGNVQWYLEKNTDNQFVGEYVKVGDEIVDFTIAQIDTYKSRFQIIKFEGEVILSGVISIYETFDGPNVLFEPDNESISLLPRYFEVNSDSFRIDNATDYFDEIKEYQDKVILISIDEYTIGNFPPGWVDTVNMIGIVD